MPSIKNLSEVDISAIDLVGGKAASLGELIQLGINVPPGFVITSEVLDHPMSPRVQAHIYEVFDELGAERVAVRSSAVAEDSANASWAGQLDTYLNIVRRGLLNAIEQCRNSANSDHARRYGDIHQIAQSERSVSVIIQAMVDSEIAGVLFTAHPVTGNRDEVAIESVYGLGELLVQGEVTPDSWTLDKRTGAVVEHHAGHQRHMLVYEAGRNQRIEISAVTRHRSSLMPRQIAQLHAVATQVEQHYGKPQDIEWAISRQNLYIVQSRPITTS